VARTQSFGATQGNCQYACVSAKGTAYWGARVATAPVLNPNPEQAAIALIQNLYQSLSEKNWQQARLAYTPALQSQFDQENWVQAPPYASGTANA
jgi:hypothetical protein